MIPLCAQTGRSTSGSLIRRAVGTIALGPTHTANPYQPTSDRLDCTRHRGLSTRDTPRRDRSRRCNDA